MQRITSRFISTPVLLIALLCLVLGPVAPRAYAGNDDTAAAKGWYNSDYIYGMTRGVRDNEDAHPGLKMTIMPVTIVLDTLLLPFAVVAGFFGYPSD